MYKEIKMICAKKGWTMIDIAQELHISESYLYKLISGDRNNKKRIQDITNLIYSDIKPAPVLKNHVKLKCREKDIKLKDLADSLNISLSYLYDILNSRRGNDLIKNKLAYFIKEGELPQ